MIALLIPGLVFFGALVLVALAQTANMRTKATTESQQSFWGFIGSALTGRSTVKAITKATRSAISHWALAQLKPITAWFVQLNVLVRQVFATNTAVMEETAVAAERITGHVIPREVGKKTAPIAKTAHGAQKTAHSALGKANATSTSLGRYKTVTNPKVAHATHAVDVTIPQQLGRVRTRTTTLEHGYAGLRDRTKALEDGALDTWKWIRAHPLTGVTGVFAGAVAIALSRLGYGFLRCRSWQRVGKRLTCGNGNSIINALEGGVPALMGALLTAELLLNFEELVKLGQTVAKDTAEFTQTVFKV